MFKTSRTILNRSFRVYDPLPIHTHYTHITTHPRIRILKIGGLGFLFLFFYFFVCQDFLISLVTNATCLTILLVHQNKLNKYDAGIKKNKHILCRYSLRVGHNLVDLNEQRIRLVALLLDTST